VPTPPIGLTLVYATTTTISFEWLDSDNDGGSQILDFRVYWDAGVGTFTLLQNSTLGMNVFHIQNGLTAGVTYQFRC
jgi:Fibronectin type III domain